MKDLEDIISEVGGQDEYQRKLLYGVIGPLTFLLPLAWMTEVFFLNVPPPWCYHPMAEGLNDTKLEAWKECYLIKENDGTYDGCHVKIRDVSNHESFWNLTEFDKCPTRNFEAGDEDDNHILVNATCQKGWSFDHSEFTRTIPIDQNWVCNNHNYVADVYTYGQAGGIVGGVIFSSIADRFGRRTTLWVTIGMVCVFMTAKTFLSNFYYAYVLLKLVAFACLSCSYRIPAMLITEISVPAHRAWVILFTWITWVFGTCLLPLIAWLSGDWFVISLITSPLMLVIFVGWNFVPESPRWILSRPNRTHEAADIFQTIARVNKKAEPANLDGRLQLISEEIRKEPHFGYVSLFTHKGLAWKVFLLTITSFCSHYTYSQLYYNINNMGGNTFLNFFLLSVIEGPALYIGLLMADNFGRRWSHTITLVINVFVFGITCFIANHHEDDLTSQWAVSLLCVFAKFNCTAAFYFYYLQSFELFPTCVRNTGNGFVGFVSAILGLAGPHIAALGTYDKRIPLGVMVLISLMGAIAGSFLPETLGCGLPETLQSASLYGSDQPYFSYIKNGKLSTGSVNEKRHADRNISIFHIF